MDKMQTPEDLEHIMIVWDCVVSQPDNLIKPVKPKAYLAVHTTLEPGLKYKLG